MLHRFQLLRNLTTRKKIQFQKSLEKKREREKLIYKKRSTLKVLGLEILGLGMFLIAFLCVYNIF